MVRSRRRCALIPSISLLELEIVGPDSDMGAKDLVFFGGLEVEAAAVFLFFFPGNQKRAGLRFFFPSAIVLNCVVTFEKVSSFFFSNVSGFNSAYFFAGNKSRQGFYMLATTFIGFEAG